MVTGADIVQLAQQQQGDPYVWAATGPDAFDCSGLVEWVYNQFGLSTPRVTYDMVAPGSPLIPIQRTDLQPGDLIFSNWEGKTSSHVGIYDGRGGIIEAPQPGEVVKTTPLGPNYWAHVDDLRRVPGVNGATGPAAGVGTGSATLTDFTIPGTGITLPTPRFPTPANVTQALTNLGDAMGSIASSAAATGKLAQLAGRALLPSNLLRAFFFGTGFIFLLVGIWFLAREIKASEV